jgi:homoserine kinase
VVSGAGPTVLAFTDATEQAEVVARAPDGWEALTVPIDRHGARVELPDLVE